MAINTPFGPEKLTFLFLAVQEQQLEIADILIKLGAHPNIGTKQGRTPLHAAVINEDEEMIKLLADANVDINATNHQKKTALSLAISEAKNPELVSFLVEDMKALINDPYSIPPLHLAIYHNQIDILEFLLAVGADIERVDANGLTPLWYAVMHENAEAVRILDKYHPDFNKTNGFRLEYRSF